MLKGNKTKYLKMKNEKLSKISLALIKDLQEDINKLLKSESNIELIWKLEKLEKQKIFSKSADLIRKELEKN